MTGCKEGPGNICKEELTLGAHVNRKVEGRAERASKDGHVTHPHRQQCGATEADSRIVGHEGGAEMACSSGDTRRRASQ